MRVVILAFSMISFSVTSGADGTDHFPLTEGIIYEYEYSIQQGSGTYITYFAGTANVGGTATHVLHIAGDSPHGRQHFWSETAEGDKLFHGAHTIGLGTPLLFSPPIPMIDEPLYVGKTWVVDSRDSDSLAVRVHFEVTAFGEVTVPAGTFQTFTVEDTWEFPEGTPAEKILACIRMELGVSGTVQYADGVGQVQEVYGSRTERLLSLRTVGVEPATWTRIRMLYR